MEWRIDHKMLKYISTSTKANTSDCDSWTAYIDEAIAQLIKPKYTYIETKVDSENYFKIIKVYCGESLIGSISHSISNHPYYGGDHYLAVGIKGIHPPPSAFTDYEAAVDFITNNFTRFLNGLDLEG